MFLDKYLAYFWHFKIQCNFSCRATTRPPFNVPKKWPLLSRFLDDSAYESRVMLKHCKEVKVWLNLLFMSDPAPRQDCR
jgi:hypothetical protein